MAIDRACVAWGIEQRLSVPHSAPKYLAPKDPMPGMMANTRYVKSPANVNKAHGTLQF